MSEKDLEDLMKELREQRYVKGSGAIPGADPTLSDRVSIELSYASHKTLEKLNDSIEKFDKNSSRLAMWMLVMSVVITVLASVQIWIMLVNR